MYTVHCHTSQKCHITVVPRVAVGLELVRSEEGLGEVTGEVAVVLEEIARNVAVGLGGVAEKDAEEVLTKQVIFAAWVIQRYGTHIQ